MNSIRLNIILFFGFLLSILFTGVTNAQFWEIPDPDLHYIAMVRADPHWGSAVIYNPDLCKQIGDACAFFRAHEYAHAFLNDLFLLPERYPDSMEHKADCWAAKYVKPHEVLATVKLFMERDRYPDLPITGDPAVRAQRVRDCAKESENWIGEE